MKRILPFFLLLALVLNGCSGAIGSACRLCRPWQWLHWFHSDTPGAKYGGEVARPLIRDLSNIGPRVAGSAGGSKNRPIYRGMFSKPLGITLKSQPFTADAEGKTISSANVVAIKNGNSSQEIIVGAHYDSTDAGPGADDNASGVAVMLEVAKLLQNVPTPYTIRFIAFGAGESGLLGSYAYLNQMSQEEFENVIAMIDLDSLIAGDMAYVFSDEGTRNPLFETGHSSGRWEMA